MKTDTIILKIEKRVNESNEDKPHLYTVMENDVVLFTTHDPIYSLQAILNLIDTPD
jgi:hypothetical protein